MSKIENYYTLPKSPLFTDEDEKLIQYINLSDDDDDMMSLEFGLDEKFDEAVKKIKNDLQQHEIYLQNNCLEEESHSEDEYLDVQHLCNTISDCSIENQILKSDSSIVQTLDDNSSIIQTIDGELYKNNKKQSELNRLLVSQRIAQEIPRLELSLDPSISDDRVDMLEVSSVDINGEPLILTTFNNRKKDISDYIEKDSLEVSHSYDNADNENADYEDNLPIIKVLNKMVNDQKSETDNKNEITYDTSHFKSDVQVENILCSSNIIKSSINENCELQDQQILENVKKDSFHLNQKLKDIYEGIYKPVKEQPIKKSYFTQLSSPQSNNLNDIQVIINHKSLSFQDSDITNNLHKVHNYEHLIFENHKNSEEIRNEHCNKNSSLVTLQYEAANQLNELNDDFVKKSKCRKILSQQLNSSTEQTENNKVQHPKENHSLSQLSTQTQRSKSASNQSLNRPGHMYKKVPLKKTTCNKDYVQLNKIQIQKENNCKGSYGKILHKKKVICDVNVENEKSKNHDGTTTNLCHHYHRRHSSESDFFVYKEQEDKSETVEDIWYQRSQALVVHLKTKSERRQSIRKVQSDGRVNDLLKKQTKPHFLDPLTNIGCKNCKKEQVNLICDDNKKKLDIGNYTNNNLDHSFENGEEVSQSKNKVEEYFARNDAYLSSSCTDYLVDTNANHYKKLPPIGIIQNDTHRSCESRNSSSAVSHLSKCSSCSSDPGSYVSRLHRKKSPKTPWYKIYTLKDYKNLQKEVPLGFLGPDYVQIREKTERLMQQKAYDKMIREQNKIKSMEKSHSKSRNNQKMNSKRKMAIDYSKTIPKPKQSPPVNKPQSALRITPDMKQQKPDMLKLLQERHEQEKAAVVAILGLKHK